MFVFTRQCTIDVTAKRICPWLFFFWGYSISCELMMTNQYFKIDSKVFSMHFKNVNYALVFSEFYRVLSLTKKRGNIKIISIGELPSVEKCVLLMCWCYKTSSHSSDATIEPETSSNVSWMNSVVLPNKTFRLRIFFLWRR